MERFKKVFNLIFVILLWFRWTLVSSPSLRPKIFPDKILQQEDVFKFLSDDYDVAEGELNLCTAWNYDEDSPGQQHLVYGHCDEKAFGRMFDTLAHAVQIVSGKEKKRILHIQVKSQKVWDHCKNMVVPDNVWFVFPEAWVTDTSVDLLHQPRAQAIGNGLFSFVLNAIIFVANLATRLAMIWFRRMFPLVDVTLVAYEYVQQMYAALN